MGAKEPQRPTTPKPTPSTVITGPGLFRMLPAETQKMIPYRAKRIVIDIPADGPVRIFYEVHGTEDVASLVDVALKAGELTEVESVPEPGLQCHPSP